MESIEQAKLSPWLRKTVYEDGKPELEAALGKAEQACMKLSDGIRRQCARDTIRIARAVIDLAREAEEMRASIREGSSGVLMGIREIAHTVYLIAEEAVVHAKAAIRNAETAEKEMKIGEADILFFGEILHTTALAIVSLAEARGWVEALLLVGKEPDEKTMLKVSEARCKQLMIGTEDTGTIACLLERVYKMWGYLPKKEGELWVAKKN